MTAFNLPLCEGTFSVDHISSQPGGQKLASGVAHLLSGENKEFVGKRICLSLNTKNEKLVPNQMIIPDMQQWGWGWSSERWYIHRAEPSSFKMMP